MRLVPVFIPETLNQTNYKCWPKFVQTDNAFSSIKTVVNYTTRSCERYAFPVKPTGNKPGLVEYM